MAGRYDRQQAWLIDTKVAAALAIPEPRPAVAPSDLRGLTIAGAAQTLQHRLEWTAIHETGGDLDDR